MRETESDFDIEPCILPPKGPVLPPENNVDISRSFYSRWFSPMNEGSLRLVVINMTLCGTTGSFFWYPYFLRLYGVYAGLIILSLCVLLSYFNCRFIFYASNRFDQNDYLSLIKEVLGSKVHTIAKATYFCDYFVTYAGGFLISWSIWQYLLYNFGVLDDSMRSSQTELEFFPYHPTVLFWRSVFVWGTFLILIPLFTRKSMDGLKYVFISYTLSFLTSVIYISFDLKEFREHYQQTGEHVVSPVKPFDIRTFQFALIFLSAFYVQPNLLTMKRDLSLPTTKRLMKTLNISHFIFLMFGVLFGGYGYYSLGDNFTSPMFILRKTFEGKTHEWVYRCLLIWTTFNAMIYLAFFNLSFRNFINSLTPRKLNQKLVNYAPLFAAAFLSWVYPKIEKVFGLNGICVCLVNGFVLPTLIKRKMDIDDGCSILKRSFWSAQIILYGVLAVVSLWQLFLGEKL